MKKSTILAIFTAAVALVTKSAFAGMDDIEKCKVIDKNGKGLIKEHKSDCASISHSCAGQNKANDPESWIIVPKGQCAKINAGNFSEISNEVKDKLEINKN